MMDKPMPNHSHIEWLERRNNNRRVEARVAGINSIFGLVAISIESPPRMPWDLNHFKCTSKAHQIEGDVAHSSIHLYRDSRLMVIYMRPSMIDLFFIYSTSEEFFMCHSCVWLPQTRTLNCSQVGEALGQHKSFGEWHKSIPRLVLKRNVRNM